MLRNKNVIAVLLVVTTTITATLSFYFWQVAKSPNLNVDGKETFVLYIPNGATYEQVVDSLHKHKIIHDEIGFQFLTKWTNYRESVRPGRYEIPPNSGNKEIVDKLRRGTEDPVKLTFNNVRTVDDLVKKIGTKLSFNGSELKALLSDPTVCQKYGFSTETILSMFLPDTYFIYWTSDASSFVDRMHAE